MADSTTERTVDLSQETGGAFFLGELDAIPDAKQDPDARKKLQHRAVVLHETGVRGATAGGEDRSYASFSLHGFADQIRQRAGRCDEAFA